MLRNIIDEILLSGPRASLRHLERTNPALDPWPQPITSEYPRHNFMTTHFNGVAIDVLKAILDDNNSKRTSQSKD